MINPITTKPIMVLLSTISPAYAAKEKRALLNQSSNLRNRIKSAGVEGMTPAQSLDGKPPALDHPEFVECLDRILRAGGVKSAGWRENKPQGMLIYPD